MTERDKATVKSIAAHAAVGALIAIPVPFVGPIFGAVVGGAYGVYKNRNRGDRYDIP